MKKWSVLLAACSMTAAAAPPDVPVMVGGNEDFDACGSLGKVQGIRTFLAVRTGPGVNYRQVDSLYNDDQMWVCNNSKDGKWLAIVYGKDPSECGVSSPIAAAGPYKGPCKSGWVGAQWVEILAG